MPRDGSGNFNLVAGNPVVTGTTIASTWANSTDSDIASGLTQSLSKDGQTVASNNLPMGTFKHTNVGNATSRNQYAAAGQVQDGSFVTLSTVSGVDTITAITIPPITAYVQGQMFNFLPAGNNATTTPTIAISGLSAVTIKKENDVALVAGDMETGVPAVIVHDGTFFILQNPHTTSLATNVTGIVAVANGGTGSSTAGGARTNLGLVIGTNVQAQNVLLQDLATYTSPIGLLTYQFTGVGGIVGVSIVGTAGQIDVVNGNAGSGNPTISIDPAYVGQTSITTLGTITTGTVPVARVSGLAASATTDTTTLSNITSGTLAGGTVPVARVSGLAASATTDTTNASNITSGTLAVAQLPALSGGNVTSSAGSGVLTIGASQVTNAMHANMANNTVKGNVSGGAAAPSDLTTTQLTTLVNQVTTALSGAVPATGGSSTSKFLRADLTWSAPTFGFTHATNGFEKLASGLIIQWGIVTGGGGGSTAVTFPTAFASACYSITTSPTPSNATINVSAVSTSGFTLTNGAGGTSSYWMAIGV